MTPLLQIFRQTLLPPSAQATISLILDCVDQSLQTQDMRKGFLDTRNSLTLTAFIFILSELLHYIVKSMYNYLTA